MRREEAHALAIAFRAELIVLMSDAKIRLHTLKRLGEADQPVTRADTVLFDIPAKPVCANNTHRLGGLGDRVALSMVGAHGTADHIRHNVAAMLAYPTDALVGEPGLETYRRDFRSLIKRAAEAVNALDAFVGAPERYSDPKALAAEADPAGPAPPDVTTK